MKKATITIKGMHCASCASNIERSLGKVSGIKNPKVSLMMKKGYVEAENSVGEKQIRDAVERTGYKILELEEE